MTIDARVTASLATVLGRSCWGVKPGFGSFLTFEFGKSTTIVRGPIAVPPGAAPAVARVLAETRVVEHGDWHLWIYCCAWELCDAESRPLVAWDQPTPEVTPLLARLEGLTLRRASIDSTTSETEFAFEGTAGQALTLETWPDPGCPTLEQWKLYLPDGDVLAIRGTGEFALGPGSSSSQTWLPLTSS